MSIACLLVPAPGLAAELTENPALHTCPVVLSDEASRRVLETNDVALHWQVRPGMTLREAAAYCPSVAVLQPHPARAIHAHRALVEAMSRLTPLVEDAAPGEVYGDLRGTELLYRDAGEIASRLLAEAPPSLQPRVGVANHRFTAFVAARHAAPGGQLTVEPGSEAEFLGPMPVDWLPLDEDEREWLRLLGLGTLRDLAVLPRRKVEAQLGTRGGRTWLAACGVDPTPVVPLRENRQRVVETAQNEPPLVGRESIALQMEQLLSRALRRVDRRFVRALHIEATTDSGHLWQRTHIMKEPCGDRDRLWLVIRTVLEQAEYPGPIAGLSLELLDLTHERGRQPGLFRAHRRRREQLDDMVRHLKVRYAAPVIHRVVERESWNRIPERRFALADYDP